MPEPIRLFYSVSIIQGKDGRVSIQRKSMTIGDAHKACLRKDLTEPEVMSCLRALVKTGDKTISMDALMQILEKKNE